MESNLDTLGNLIAVWKDELTTNILPFWHRAVDQQDGGVFTCFSNDGAQLLSTNKYTWSQGRFLWNWSRNAYLIQKGILQGDVDTYLQQALKTAEFIENHAFLENGNCAFLLSKTGEKLEPEKGQGYDTSFYADCFVVAGFCEYARVTANTHYFELAVSLFHRIEHRLSQGTVRSEPYPAPKGFIPYAYHMILLGIVTELTRTSRELGASSYEALKQTTFTELETILLGFHDQQSMRPYEMRPILPSSGETILERHITPGHTLECMWFCMHAAQELGETDRWIKPISQACKFAFEHGWDYEYQGLFRYTDYMKGQDEPWGKISPHEDPYEKLIWDTWSAKIWWVHSEALYTTALMALRSGDETFGQYFEMVQDYTLRTFPNPDKDIGEWVQIRDRQGTPLNKVVALPVKDPFHIMRNLQLLVELLHDEVSLSKERGSEHA